MTGRFSHAERPHSRHAGWADEGVQAETSRTRGQGEPATHRHASGEPVPGRAPELSVIIPTVNEAANVPEIVRRLRVCLSTIAWEVIFVDDDSSDGTAALVRSLGREDRRIRCVHRIGRRGLASACMEGVLASSASFLAVMDADLQHDETLLPTMLQILQNEDVEVVIGSRYLLDDGVGAWTKSRVTMSRFAARLSRLVSRADLTDPMSGFFMFRREFFETRMRSLSAIGFKILLDLFASSPQTPRFRELPYRFRARRAGASKLDAHVVWTYGMLLLEKLIGHLVPIRFVVFAFIGGLGVGVHFAALSLLYRVLQLDFVPSQTGAALTAMTFNFALNNVLTYRDRRLRGWYWLRGWFSFVLACSIGALANVGIAAYLFRAGDASWPIAALAGVFVGSVWNYAVTSVYTWRPDGVRR
jgi:dolichol-phosphate mannosyltransferase